MTTDNTTMFYVVYLDAAEFC